MMVAVTVLVLVVLVFGGGGGVGHVGCWGHAVTYEVCGRGGESGRRVGEEGGPEGKGTGEGGGGSTQMSRLRDDLLL